MALSQIHQLDDGGYYHPSKLQGKLYKLWVAFWEWAYIHVGDQPYAIVHVGDVTDGVHHRTTQLSSGNLSTQASLSVDMMQPHVSRSSGYYQIRGTEAHVGASAEEEEQIAKELGAVKDKETNKYSRWELWMKFGDRGKYLIHFAHHVGATTSTAYETSALQREITSAYTESGKSRWRPPDLIVRGHTHRFIRVQGQGGWQGIKLPGWQAKTAFAYKIDRMRGPEFGGIVIREIEGRLSVLDWVQSVKQTSTVTI